MSSRTLSKSSKIFCLGWWMEQTTARPDSDSFRTVAMMWYAVYESRPLVGSSRKRMLGLVMSSTPMAVRLRSPPLIPRRSTLPIRVSLHSWRPSSRMTSSARWIFSARLMVLGRRRRAV